MQETSDAFSSDSSLAVGDSVGMKIVKVAVAVPLSRSFDYLPNGELKRYQPGCRVVVPFGRSTRVGVVVGTGTSTLDKSKGGYRRSY